MSRSRWRYHSSGFVLIWGLCGLASPRTIFAITRSVRRSSCGRDGRRRGRAEDGEQFVAERGEVDGVAAQERLEAVGEHVFAGFEREVDAARSAPDRGSRRSDRGRARRLSSSRCSILRTGSRRHRSFRAPRDRAARSAPASPTPDVLRVDVLEQVLAVARRAAARRRRDSGRASGAGRVAPSRRDEGVVPVVLGRLVVHRDADLERVALPETAGAADREGLGNTTGWPTRQSERLRIDLPSGGACTMPYGELVERDLRVVARDRDRGRPPCCSRSNS